MSPAAPCLRMLSRSRGQVFRNQDVLKEKQKQTEEVERSGRFTCVEGIFKRLVWRTDTRPWRRLQTCQQQHVHRHRFHRQGWELHALPGEMLHTLMRCGLLLIPNVEKSAGGNEEMLLTLMPLVDAVVRSTSRKFSKLRVCQARLIRKAPVDGKVVPARCNYRKKEA